MLANEDYSGDIRENPARLKVLIVENEGVVALDIGAMVERFGHQVIGITDSGRKAIGIAKQNHPDIVLMDIRIEADLNGIETAICLQGLFERPLPVVFVTGYPTKDFPVIKAVYPYMILKKPFSEKDLESNITKMVTA